MSKAVFEVLVMELVEEGVLDLDKPLQVYLPKSINAYVPTKNGTTTSVTWSMSRFTKT